MQTKRDGSVVTSPEEKRRGSRRALVLGLGNILLKDEGIGVHIIGQLQKQDLPDTVEVIDGGTAGLDILLSQEGGYRLVVIDAMKAGKEPGTIYETRLKADGIESLAEIFDEERQSKISLHQVGLIDALLAAKKAGCAPEEITIIGVEPKGTDEGLEPTAEVKRRIPQIINMVLEEIKDAVH
jgi:hydrogenase maturation protease